MRPAALALLTLLLLACGGGDGETRVELRVVDLNVLHGLLDEDPDAQPYDRFPERLPLIVGAVAGVEPDLVLLQEGALAGEGYPDVRGALATALGEEYTIVFGDTAGRPVGEGTLGQLTATRRPVVSSENHAVGPIRAVLRVTVETPAGPLAVYNAHLEGTGAIVDVGPEAPLDEIEAVIDFVEATRDGAPAVLAGDFNAEPGDASIERLLAAGFIDAVAVAGDATCNAAGDRGCTSSTLPLGGNGERNAARRIDYVFVLPGDGVDVDVVSAATFLDGPVTLAGGGLLWPSDHIGVEAVIGIGGR